MKTYLEDVTEVRMLERNAAECRTSMGCEKWDMLSTQEINDKANSGKFTLHTQDSPGVVCTLTFMIGTSFLSSLTANQLTHDWLGWINSQSKNLDIGLQTRSGLYLKDPRCVHC